MKEKIIYLKSKNSEFKIYHDEYGMCLIPTENTPYDLMMKLGFKEWRFGCYRLDFANPENYHHTWDEVVDVVEQNGVLAMVYLNQNGKFEMHPAFGGSGFVIDSYYHDLYYGKPVFIKVKCHCGHEFFFNDNNIPMGEKYECECPKCKSLLMRKKA